VRRVVVLAVALAALAGATHASARQECSAGTRSSGGTTYRTFCGPAHATLEVGGKTLTFTGGSCQVSGTIFSINIGTITLPPGKPKYDYFGITVMNATKGGLYKNQAVGWQLPHGKQGSLIRTTIALAKDRKTGTFSGSPLTGGGKGIGHFSCS
jgi:hypothetical protein